MHRKHWIIGAAVIALVVGAFAPVMAQDGLTPEQQAALDDVRAAFLDFVALDSYSADVTQVTDQDLAMAILAQHVRLVQRVDAQGALQLARVEGNEVPNQTVSLTQTITQQITGMGQDQQITLGPMLFEMIIADDRVYLRVELPPDLAGFAPEGWQDVTGGAGQFPGMDLFDINQLVDMTGSSLQADMINALFDAVTDIEVVDSAGTFDIPVVRYRLTLDTRRALEDLEMMNLDNVFNAEQMPFDIPAMIELIYTDEDTRYLLEIAIATDDGRLVEYTQIMVMDIVLPPSMITDPTLAEAEISLAQTTMTTLLLAGFNEPVEIVAPVLGQ